MYKEALSFCDEALQKDPHYVKALYLKAKVLNEMTDYTKAIDVLKNLLEIDAENKDGIALLQKV